jgi:hypothetical protein
MIEMVVVIAFFLGGYEYGKVSVETQPCTQTLATLECPEIYPPEDASFGAETRAYSSLVTQYRKCKAASQQSTSKP